MNRRAFFKTATLAPGPRLRPGAGVTSDALVPYTEPLDRAAAAHLLRRMHLGAAPEAISSATGKRAPNVVAEAIVEALNKRLPRHPEWVDEGVPKPSAPRAEREAYDASKQGRLLYYRMDWVHELRSQGLRERMALFWSSHFATATSGYEFIPPYAVRYLHLLRQHALGNFKTFVYEIGLNDAMLVYLNGNTNEAGAPNENYARELLELFTMGQTTRDGTQNYTQQDIEEIARALTGWTTNPHKLNVKFRSALHDGGSKTIFGRTGTFRYDDVIDIIFEERATEIAEFICTKLYRALVYDTPNQPTVNALAAVFVENNFEIAPVLEALFASQHFYEPQWRGAQLKSPMALFVGMLRDLHITANYDDLLYNVVLAGRQTGQYLLDPPNVAGWPGHRHWLDTNAYATRNTSAEILVQGGVTNLDPFDLLPVAEQLIDPTDGMAAFRLPVALAQHLLPFPLALLPLDAPADDFAGDLLNNPLPDDIVQGPAYQRTLARIFLAGTPWYEWNIYEDDAIAQVRRFVAFLTRLPEFQLY